MCKLFKKHKYWTLYSVLATTLTVLWYLINFHIIAIDRTQSSTPDHKGPSGWHELGHTSFHSHRKLQLKNGELVIAGVVGGDCRDKMADKVAKAYR